MTIFNGFFDPEFLGCLIMYAAMFLLAWAGAKLFN